MEEDTAGRDRMGCGGTAVWGGSGLGKAGRVGRLAEDGWVGGRVGLGPGALAQDGRAAMGQDAKGRGRKGPDRIGWECAGQGRVGGTEEMGKLGRMMGDGKGGDGRGWIGRRVTEWKGMTWIGWARSDGREWVGWDRWMPGKVRAGGRVWADACGRARRAIFLPANFVGQDGTGRDWARQGAALGSAGRGHAKRGGKK